MKWISIARSPAHITSLTEGLSSFLERLWGLKLRTHQKTSLNSRVFILPCKVRGKLLCKLQIEHLFSVTLVSVVSSNAAILSGCNGDVTESFPSQLGGCFILHSSFFVFGSQYFFLNYFSLVLLLNYFYHLIIFHCLLVI